MKDRSVLIVEDEGLIALYLEKIFQTSGYRVSDMVSSGEDAIKYVRTSAPLPDLILMDVSLNGEIDGIETARRIRDLLDIPILFLSAHLDAGQTATMETLAPCGFLGKPFIYSDVTSAVENLLQR